jgi:hypothetical protein
MDLAGIMTTQGSMIEERTMATDRTERARNLLFDGQYADQQKPQYAPSMGVPIRTGFTIQEAKVMRHDLAKRIEALLMDFSEATGLSVDFIDVEMVEDFSARLERYRVSVEAKL